jgi:hypothetical protein
MQYILLIYSDEKQWAKLNPAEMDKIYGAYMSYSKALADAGVIRGGAELKPVSTATTVRVRNGKTTTLDGPFAETKEQLGGYYVIDVPNLEKALEWAAKIPGATEGSIEVRPLGMTPDKS